MWNNLINNENEYDEKNIIITAGKGIGKQILFDCIENDIFVYGVIDQKKILLKLKKNLKAQKIVNYITVI